MMRAAACLALAATFGMAPAPTRGELSTARGPIVVEWASEPCPDGAAFLADRIEKGAYAHGAFERVIPGCVAELRARRVAPHRFDAPSRGSEFRRGGVYLKRRGDPLESKTVAPRPEFLADVDGTLLFALGDEPPLDGAYARVGTVTRGLELLDALAAAPRRVQSNGELSRPAEPLVVESAALAAP